MALGQLPRKAFSLMVLVLGTVAVEGAFADNSNTSTETAAAVEAKPASAFSLLTVLGFDTNRAPVGDVDSSMSTSFELWPKYKFSETSNLLGYFALSQELTGEREFTTSDTTLSWQVDSKPLTQGLKFKPYVRASLPTSKASLIDAGLVAGLRGATQVAYEVGDLSGFFELSAGRNFHVDTVALSGKSNNAWAAGGRFYVAWSISDKWGLAGDFRMNSGWTYQTAAPRTTFLFGQELSYQVNDAFGVSLSHSNEGDVLKANGIDTNVAIVSDQGSKISLSASYQL